MKTTFSSSFTNPSFSLSYIGVDRFRFLLKGWSVKVLSLLLLVMFGGVSWGQAVIATSTTTAGNYTVNVPAGVSKLSVELTGGGGGGGSNGSNKWARGGGGAGGTYIKHLLSVSSGTYNYTVGAGGASATVGSNSFFGNSVAGTQGSATVVANGGAAGISASGAGTSNTAWNTAAANTAVTTGSLPASGYLLLYAGTNGSAGTGTGNNPASLSGAGGAGAGYAGSSAGGAGAPSVAGYSANGTPGSAPGGGGSGGINGNNTSLYTGGVGGTGKAIITYYVVPTVSSLSVSSGPSGTSVTVTGTNFYSGVSKITVDGTEISTTYLTSTTLSASITGLAGAHSIGVNNSDVTATGFGISSSTSTLTFTIATFTNYYSKATGNLETLSNWGTAPDGTGTSPSNFTDNNQVFYIRNNATPTIGAAWTVSGTNSKIIVGDGTNGCNFTIPALYAVTATIDVAAAATLTLQHLTVFPTFGTLNAAGTIVFDGNGAQTIPAGTYPNLTVQNSGGVKTLGGNIVLGNSNTLTVATSTILDAAAYTITYGTSGAANINGTIRTANTNGFSGASTTTIVSTNSPTITLGASSTIVYNSALAQAVTSRTYANLQISNTGAAKTPGGNITLGNSNTFTLDAGVTYKAGTTTMTFGTSGTAIINGIFQTGITAAGGFSGTTTSSIVSTNTPTITLATGSTVEYNSTSSQTISTANSSGTNGTLTYYNLLISGTTTVKTFNASPAIAAGGTFTINSNCTVNFGTTSMTLGAGSFVVINGTLQTQAATGFSGGPSTSISNTNSPTITLGSSSTIEYSRTSVQGVSQTITARDYRNLIISGTSTMSLGGNITIQGGSTMTVSSNLACGNNTISQSGSGTATISVTGTISTTNIDGLSGSATTTITSSNTSLTLGGASTVDYASTSSSNQTITAGTYFNITNTGSTATSIGRSLSGTINISGAFTTGSGYYTIGTSTVNFNGSTAQTIPVLAVASGGNYYNLSYSGSSTGTLSGSSTVTVNGDLTVSSGTLSVNATTTQRTINVTGNFVQSGGTFDGGSVDPSTGVTSIINLSGNFNKSSGSFTNTASSTPFTLNFVKIGTQTFSNSGAFEYANININSSSIVTALTDLPNANGALQIDGTLDMDSYQITNLYQNSVVTINGVLKTKKSAGLTNTSTTSAISSTNTTITLGNNSTIEYGAALVTQTVTARPDYANITLSGGSAKTLGGASIVSGVLTLTSGVLTTTSTNTLTLTNTSNTAISGGSTTSFVNGPLRWTLPSNLVSGTTYAFPVGKSSTYLPFSLNPVTGVTGPVVQVEAFASSTGGTAGTGVASISSTEYWQASVVSGNLSSASVSLTRQSSLGGNNIIVRNTSTLAGSYTSLNGTTSGTSINNSDNTGTSLGYFAMGVAAQAPTITSLGSSSGCIGSSITINGTNLTGATAVTIGGTPVSSITSNSGSVLIAVIGSGTTGTVAVTTNGGTANSSGNFTVNPLPTVTWSAAATSVCYSASAQTTSLAYSSTTNSPTLYSISWSASPTNSFSAINDQLNTFNSGSGTIIIDIPAGTAAGTYSGNITVKNANGCVSSSSTFTITVNGLPTTSNAGSPQTICQSATLAANAPTTGTGIWTVTSGPSTLSSQFSSTSSRTAIFTPAGGSGAYVLTWTISNGTCTASASNVTITVNASPTAANAGSPQTICSNGTATLAANTPTIGTGAWTISSGPSTSASQLSSTTDPSAIFTPSSAGSYVLTWTISNSPCTASTSNVTITVNAATAINTHPSTGTQTTTLNGISFSTISVSAVGGGLSYQWYNNTTNSNSGGTLISNATSASYTPVNSTLGTLYYYCIVSSSACSPATVTSNTTGVFTVNPQPTINSTPTSLAAFSTTAGTASTAQAFTVTGANLIADITVTAPTGFEVSQTAGGLSGYAATQTLTQASGSVSKVIYVRLTTSATGTPSGNVGLTSTSALTVNVVVSGTVNATSATLIAGWDFQTTTNGGTPVAVAPNFPTTVVANFGSGNIYLDGTNGSSTWIFATSGNELTAFAGTNSVNTGTGFSTTTSTGSLSLIAATGLSANNKSVVIKFNMTGYQDLLVSYAAQTSGATGFTTHQWDYSTNGINWTTGQTITSIQSSFSLKTLAAITDLNGSANAFLRLTVSGASGTTGNNRIDNIQLNATPNPTPTIIVGGGPLSSLSTTYGTSSAASSFTVSGSNLTNDISVAAPTGFEVSTSNTSGFGASVSLTQTSGSVNATTIYIRLAAASVVGTYANNIVCSSTGASSLNIPMPSSIVSKATPVLSISSTNPVTYNGSSQSATVSGTGNGTVTNVTYTGNGTTTYSSSTTAPTNAGTYAVTADIAATTNYNAATGASAGTFTISKATPTLSIGNSPQTYSGSTIAATVSGSVAGVVSNVKYGGSLTVPTNAGTYAVTAILVPTDGTNYNSLTDVSAGNFVISKADQSITFASTNSVFNTVADYNPGATSATSGINAITYTSSNPAVATIVSGNIHVTGVGQTTITASQASSDNYNSASTTQTLTVNAYTSIITQPVGYTILATGATPTALTVTAIGTNLSYQWYSNTANSTSNSVAINSATSSNFTPPSTSGAMYYYVVVHGDYGSDVTSDVVAVVISDIFTWNGSVSTDWNTAANWTPASVPIATANVSVPSLTNNPVIYNLTIASNGSVTLASGTMLTISGIITNNGTFTIESGATLVQTGTGTNIGNGTYNVKQTVSGSGGSTPNGRFWYLGSPISNGLSTALLSSTGNQLWQWNESSFAYATVSTGQTLTQGRSYVLRSGQTTETINFSGTGLSNGSVTVPNLTRTGTSQQFRGCHLVSNPYPSYLDWDMVGKTNVSTTMYVRTASGSTIDILETYNSANGQGTNISGPAMTKYIAPMQGFWVKVSADGQTGSLTMNNSMRSHQASGSGLRSTAQDFPAFLRFNMIDGQNKDQVILLMSPDASMSLDAFDSEKMSATGYAQFYSTVNATKLVINGMKNVKAKTSVPLTLVMPTSKSYTFQAEEFNIEDGLILLEDKQEGVIQDLTINPTYSFFGNAGTNATRFVVHFQLASAPVLVGGPQELENLGMDQLSTDNIQITSDNQGTVIVRLDEGFKPEGSIRIFDASGRLVEQTDFNDQETTIQLNEKAGMYFVEVSAGKLMVKKKIVIN